jgi:hypothetical protein
MPVISVLLDRRTSSLGAGETPIVGIAPAIGNAIFDATGSAFAVCRCRRRLPGTGAISLPAHVPVAFAGNKMSGGTRYNQVHAPTPGPATPSNTASPCSR